MEEIRRQISWATTFDLPLHEISAAQAQELFPLMDTTGVVGGAYLPSDGYVDPSQLCYALANLARRSGVQVHPYTRVTGIDAEKGRVARVHTDRGSIECATVVNCGGMFAAEIGRLLDVRVPLVPISHQYVITEGFFERPEDPLPTLRDPDLLVYYRQEVDGLVMGGYERDPEPWTADATTYDRIPADFNGRLLPESWGRFEQITANSQVRVPAMADVGLRKIINGPEAFTPDNEFLLGETEVDGFFVAAGFCAHGIAGAGGIGKVMAEWIVSGEPGLDLWHMDIRRFGKQYRSPSYTLKRTLETYETYYDIVYPGHERSAGRPLRTAPAYAWHAAHGASFGEKSGWERVNYYADNEVRSGTSLRPRGWAGRHWSSAIGVEHHATREAAGLFDESSFAKMVVTGPDAADLLEWVCDNHVARAVGDITYTQALNRRGGIEADFTVTRVEQDAFMVVTGTAFGSHDMSWLRRQARRRSAAVRIDDATGQYVCYALWGPRSRDILRTLTGADLSNKAFPFMTAQEISVGDIAVRALRVTFTGELGWELYASAEYGAALWSLLWSAGEGHGLTAGGYRAIESLRLEKGYRVWSTDVTPETNPYEAGLGFCVKLDKPGGFEGADALRQVKEQSVNRRLRCLTVDDPEVVALGNEPVRIDGQLQGRVTSGGFGYTVGRSIAYAYLPVDASPVGTPVSVNVFGEWVPGVVAAQPLLDPKSTKVHADG
jgi:glycine cleavage system aminomethyltransferase T/glycine/D-amino acid oxidase-like deaminating enzyme